MTFGPLFLDLDLRPYEEITAILREDLFLVQNQTFEFTSVNELRQVDILLTTLEAKLSYLKKFLLKLDPRTGLVNFGGVILKTLFGTATISDLHSLHEVLSELQLHEKDIVSSHANHVTEMKSLDTVTSTNSDVLANLSSIVKGVVIQSHDIFMEITRDVMWLNVTLHDMSDLYVVIRQLEFVILRVNQNSDELVVAIQCVFLGKLPINLVSPDTLHNILVNTSRFLLENYELFAGINFENLYIYYDMVKVAIVGDAYSIRLILNVPLKTSNVIVYFTN
jgi:hypothetical protein